MRSAEEEQLYKDLWNLITKLASEPTPESHAKALSLIAQNCQTLDYPQSADLFIKLATSEYPRQQKDQEALFLISVSRLTRMHMCCGEHQDSERQIALEILVEQMKKNASQADDIEDELQLLDTLKFLKGSREAREERESGSSATTEAIATEAAGTSPATAAIGTAAAVADLSMPRASLGTSELFDLKYELQSFKFEIAIIRDDFGRSHDVLAEKLEHLNERTTSRFGDLNTRIDEKLSNRSLGIGIAVAVFIAVVGILIGILLVA